MSQADGMRARLPSWVHEDGSMVRLKAASEKAAGTEAARAAVGTRERRRTCRIPVELTVFVHAANHFFQAETADVSQGGMFVVTDRVVLQGTRVVLDFALGGGEEPLEIEAVVRWTRTEDDHRRTGAPRGLALVFDELTAATQARIEAYCKVREPLYFDLFEGAS